MKDQVTHYHTTDDGTVAPETSPPVALFRWADHSPGGIASANVIVKELWQRGGRHRDAAEILTHAFSGKYSCPKGDGSVPDDEVEPAPLPAMVDAIDNLAVEGLTPVLHRIAETLAHHHERLTALEERDGEPIAERPWPTELAPEERGCGPPGRCTCVVADGCDDWDGGPSSAHGGTCSGRRRCRLADECKRGRETLQKLAGLNRQLVEQGDLPSGYKLLRVKTEAHDELCTLLAELS